MMDALGTECSGPTEALLRLLNRLRPCRAGMTRTAVLFCIASSCIAFAQAWEQRYPAKLPVGYSAGIVRWNGDTLFTAGANSAFMISSDAGASWRQLIPDVGYNFMRIAAGDGAVFLAAGPTLRSESEFSDTAAVPLFRYEVETGAFQRLSLPIFIPSTRGIDLRVHIEHAGGCLMALEQSGRSSAPDTTAIAFSTDGGLQWEGRVLPDSLLLYDASMHFFDRSRGLIVTRHLFGSAYITTDGGSSWSRVPGFRSVQGDPFDPFLAAQWVTDSIIVVFSESNIPMLSMDAGKTWNTRTALPVYVTSCSFTNDGVGYAIGRKLEVYKTSDFGAQWVFIKNGLTPPGMDAAGYGLLLDKLRYVVVSRHGGFYFRTTDGGVSWEHVQYAEWSYPRIQFTDALHGILTAVSNDASEYLLLRTSDGGKSWIDAVTTTELGSADVVMIDPNVLIAVRIPSAGNDTMIYRSTDGGVSWSGILRVAAGDTLKPDKTTFRFSRFAPSLLVILTNEGCLISSDRGATWKPVPRQDGTTDLRVVGESSNFRTTTQGSAWLQRKTIVLRSSDFGSRWDTVLTLRAGAPSYARFTAMYVYGDTAFVLSDNGTSQGDSVPPYQIHASTDNGLHWTSYPTAFSMIPASLFVNGTGIGSLATTIGPILDQTRFYRTTDGWRTGTITQDLCGLSGNIRFVLDETHAWMTGPNFLYIFATTNGGIDWTETPLKVSTFALEQSYPNPAMRNGTIFIPFVISRREQRAALEIFDLLGRKTATVATGSYPPGRHTVEWSASRILPGVYFVRMMTAEGAAVRRMVVR